MRVLRPDHPIVAGVPLEFQLPATEMYDEPFHVPDPDEVILEDAGRPESGSAAAPSGSSATGVFFTSAPGTRRFPSISNRSRSRF